jgi:hypothetical protein
VEGDELEGVLDACAHVIDWSSPRFIAALEQPSLECWTPPESNLLSSLQATVAPPTLSFLAAFAHHRIAALLHGTGDVEIMKRHSYAVRSAAHHGLSLLTHQQAITHAAEAAKALDACFLSRKGMSTLPSCIAVGCCQRREQKRARSALRRWCTSAVLPSSV